MTPADLVPLFAHPQRVVTLSTVDGQGRPNAAVFGSARLLDEERVIVALTDNRTLDNLSSQPQAVLLLAVPGPQMLAWQGARLYLACQRIEHSGPLLEHLRQEVAEAAGAMAAHMTTAVAVLHIDSIRPLLDRPARPRS